MLSAAPLLPEFVTAPAALLRFRCAALPDADATDDFDLLGAVPVSGLPAMLGGGANAISQPAVLVPCGE